MDRIDKIDGVKKVKNPFAGWLMFFVPLAIFIFVGHSITHMVGAGDTWVAMACGRHFLNQGIAHPNVEPFSANSHKAGPTDEGMKKYAKLLRHEAKIQRLKADPVRFSSLMPEKNNPIKRGSKFKAAVLDKWADFCQSYENWPGWLKSFAKWIHPTGWVNQNWLTHVNFYWLTHIATGSVDEPNYNALVWWKFTIYMILAVCVYYATRIMGATEILSALAACLSVFVGRSFYDVRPAGYSNMLTAVLLLLYVLTAYKNYRYIWLLLPLVIFWSNIHGGFIYVFITLVPFIGTNFLLLLNKKYRIIFYSAGAAILLLKAFITVSNTKYIPEESQMAFLEIIALGFALIIGGIIFVKFEDRFVKLSKKALIHCTAAAVLSFIAAIFLNPYKLTNFTHTLIVSVSEQASMWRQVHEWHPSFEWNNPVGTVVPFMILVYAVVGFGLLWLINYVSRLKFERVSDLSDSSFRIWSFLNRSVAAIVIFWILMLSFQLTNPGVAYLLAAITFIVFILLTVDVSIWLIVGSGVLSLIFVLIAKDTKAYSGMYIYPMLILPAYVIINIFFSKQRRFDSRSLLIVTATAILSFFIMMNIGKVNPIGLSIDGVWATLKNFMTMKAPFKPVYYSGGNKDALTTYSSFFTVIAALNIFAVIGWFWAKMVFTGDVSPSASLAEDIQDDRYIEYSLPKIDLTLLIIAIITIFMAMKMRRFVTLVGVMVSPFAAIFIDQLIKSAVSIYNRKKMGSFSIGQMNRGLRNAIACVCIVFVLSFGLFWSIKFKRIYLDPYISDSQAKLSTVFMRMTASNAKPFYACKFIRDNKLSGNMFNYWTEGGFIAYGQTPDPNTGQTPLKLYMDGRAQAAYDPAAYIDWIEIMGAGEKLQLIKASGRRPTPREYGEAGKWINKKMKKKNVWVIMMPADQFNSDFLKAVTTLKNWRVVFYNGKQKIFVDIDTQKGRQLFTGIFDGKVVFPDEFSKNLTVAYNLLLTNDRKALKMGLNAADKAIKDRPCQASLMVLNLALRHKELLSQVVDICREIDTDFKKNKQKYKNENGYKDHLIAYVSAVQVLSKFNETYTKAQANEVIKGIQDQLLQRSKFVRW